MSLTNPTLTHGVSVQSLNMREGDYFMVQVLRQGFTESEQVEVYLKHGELRIARPGTLPLATATWGETHEEPYTGWHSAPGGPPCNIAALTSPTGESTPGGEGQ